MNPDDLTQLEEALSAAFDQIGNYEPNGTNPISISSQDTGPAPVDTGMEGRTSGPDSGTSGPVYPPADGGYQPWTSPGGGYGGPSLGGAIQPMPDYTGPSEPPNSGPQAPAGSPAVGGSRTFAGQSINLPSSAGFGRGPDNIGLGDIGNPEDNYSFNGPSDQKRLGGFLEEVLTGGGGGVLGDALRSAFGGIRQASGRADILDNPGMADSLRGVRGSDGRVDAGRFVDDVKRNNLVEVRPETDGNGSLYQRFRYEAGNTDDRLLRYGPEKPKAPVGRPNGGIPYRRNPDPDPDVNYIDVNDLGQYERHVNVSEPSKINGIQLLPGDTVVYYPNHGDSL